MELYPGDQLYELGPEWRGSACEADLRRNEAMGFRLVRGMCSLLKQYEDNRSQYRTFRDFYPEILEWLRSEERKLA